MADRRQRRTRHRDDGYTLTEMLVVLVVIALVAASFTPMVMNRFGSAQVRSAAIQTESLAADLDMFFIDVGRYPNETEGLKALLSQPADAAGWAGPYVRSQRNLIDPWGRDFVYEPASDGFGARVISLGADGARGGEGRAADIVFP